MLKVETPLLHHFLSQLVNGHDYSPTWNDSLVQRAEEPTVQFRRTDCAISIVLNEEP